MPEQPALPRVLQVGPDPTIGGGMPTAQRALLESPLREGYELDVLVTYRRPGKLGQLLDFSAALARIAAWSLAGRGRIVHVHATVRGSSYRKAIVIGLAKALRRRVVLQMHSGADEVAYFSWTRDKASLRLFRTAFGAADVVLAVSAASASMLSQAYRLADVQVVPNPAPVIPPFERAPAADGEVRAAYLGGFANVAKGGDVLVEALERALPQAPKLRVRLAGPGEPPPEAEALIEREPRVEWVGWCDAAQKDALLRGSDVFVIPSRSEGLPMALLEGMAYGLAVVATEAGGIPEVVDPGEDGLLVPTEDPAALAEALCSLAIDEGLRERLAAGALAKARSLDADVVARRLGEIYATLL
ncbi:MAG TPA: glycosyltransferase family 4 protein [Solirubrobacterales bacterium]|nr:glycosyltransferase family 4 protein [Solirubrobacterales bacterium]